MSWHRQWAACLLLLVCTCGALGVRAANPTFYHSPLTSGFSLVKDLQGIWFDENGNRHIVPFSLGDRDEMVVTQNFDLPNFAELQDTVYLYCEALAWSSTVTLNGKLLAVTEDPFAEHLLPLDKKWLLPAGNALVISLSTEGVDFPWYPKRFLGVFRQVALLQSAELPSFARFPRRLAHASKAVLVAPWSSTGEYIHDTLAIRRHVLGLFSYPYRHPLAFPFRPSNRSLSLLAAAGWEMVVDASEVDSLAAYNTYPVSNGGGRRNLEFWRDGDGRPTASYGQYLSQTVIEAPGFRHPSTASLIVFVLIPALCMFLLKMLAPKAYSSLGEYVTKTKIYLELIADNKFLKVEQRWLMNLIRMLVTTVTISLLLFYVQNTDSWSVLNVFSSHSLLYRWLHGFERPVWEIFLWTLTAVLCSNLLKYFMVNAVGTVFRVFTLGSTIQNLDVFASFPLNLLPYVPATFIFFLDPETGTVVLRVWMGLCLLYGARRVYLMYNGLARLYQISGSLKILYICTLEILPWAILI